MEEKLSTAEAFVSFFKTHSVKPDEANPVLESKNSAPIRQSDKMFKVFSRPNIGIEDVRKFAAVDAYINDHDLDREVIEQAEIQVKYSGYIAKEKNNADKLTRLEYVKIPTGYDYSQIKSMSYEAREKLKKVQPTTVAQASRISGVSPNDISVLLVYMGR
jgi:tRNA uridine 5-carboxymethylaminomethyl modification enzyme